MLLVYNFMLHTITQENKSYEDIRRELEESNPILELDPRLVDGGKSFEDFPKYPLEKLQAAADDLPEDVDKTRREVNRKYAIILTTRNHN